MTHPNIPPIPTKNRRLSSGARLAVPFVVSLVIVALLGTVVLAVGTYSQHWRSSFVSSVTRVVPVPAVSVNGTWRPYHDFLEAFETLNYSFDKPELLQASGFTEKPNAQQLEQIVLDRMVKDEIVKQLAGKRKIVVSPADVDEQMRKIIDQSGSAEEVTAKIKELYRWDVTTFKRRVVEPFLIRQRLQESIAMDESLNATERKRAEDLLVRVQAGKDDFQAIAREVNEDVTKDTGGDLGIFTRGERDQALEDAAFTLEVGQTSDIVRSKEGYHILKLLEKLPADSATSDGERVHVAHIFVSAKALDAWLFDQAQSQRVSIFLNGYRWNGSQARVLTTSEDASSTTNTTP